MMHEDDRSDLAELYQEMVLDHGKSPRNHRAIESPDRTAEGYNPLCGDQVTVYLAFDGGAISDVSFESTACAICTASSSMMTRALKGKSEAEARAMFASFQTLLTDETVAPDEDTLGPLVALGGVRRYPMRVKCATLPWHTLKAALDEASDPTTTE